MEQSAAEIVIENNEAEVEAPSWQRVRTREDRMGFIAIREEFLKSQGVEL